MVGNNIAVAAVLGRALPDLLYIHVCESVLPCEYRVGLSAQDLQPAFANISSLPLAGDHAVVLQNARVGVLEKQSLGRRKVGRLGDLECAERGGSFSQHAVAVVL